MLIMLYMLLVVGMLLMFVKLVVKLLFVIVCCDDSDDDGDIYKFIVLKFGKGGIVCLLMVVIDLGYGGEDLGVIGGNGMYEKYIVFDIVKKLCVKIDVVLNMCVMMMCDVDFFVLLNVCV